MKRYPCETCSFHSSALVDYRNRKLCYGCYCEYRKIFDGWVSINDLKTKIDQDEQMEFG